MPQPLNFQRLRQQQMFGAPQPIPELADWAPPPIPPQQPLPSRPLQFPIGVLPNVQPNGSMTPPPEPPQEMQQEPPFDEAAFSARRMRDLYQPHYEASNRLNDLMNQFPQRTDPSKMRRLGASAMGLANVGKKNVSAADRVGVAQLQERFLDAPYARGVEEFKAKAEPTLKAADIERAGNVNERGFANQIISQELAYRKQTEVERKNRAEQEIRNKRAEVYDWKAKHGNAKIIARRGGNIIAINPSTGETIKDFGPSGLMSEEDRINLENAGDIQQIERRTQGDIFEEAERQLNRERLARLEAEERRRTKAAPGSDDEVSFTQRKVGEYTRARELYNTQPWARKYITLGTPGTNDFKIKEQGKSLWGWGSPTGPSDQELQKLKDYIYGSEAPAPSRTAGTPGTGNQGQTQGADLQQRAADFLRQNNQQVTPANVDHAIRQGWVK
jgi:hypothetical protein